jgi:hypothetical protein
MKYRIWGAGDCPVGDSFQERCVGSGLIYFFIDREPGRTTILFELGIDIAKFKSLERQNILPNPKNLLVVLLVEYSILKKRSTAYHFIL